MQIFVINMKTSHDRWKSISTQLSALKLPLQRFDAVIGKDIDCVDKFFDIERFEFESYHKLKPGEVGCALSHINIWKHICDNQISEAIVLEDDAKIDRVFFETYNALINNKLKLDYVNLSPVNTEENFINTHFKPMTAFQFQHLNVIECGNVPYSMVGYYINFRAAEIFLKASKNMYYAVDLLPRYTFPYTRQGFAYPSGVNLLDFESEIEQTGGRFYTERQRSLKNFFYFLFNKKHLRTLSVRFERIRRLFVSN